MSIRAQLIGAAVLVLLGMAAAWIVQEWRHDAKHARLQAAHAQLLEQQAQAVVESVQAARNEEQRRTAAVENERDTAIEQIEALGADVAAGRSLSGRLRTELNALRARYTSRDSAAAVRGSGEQGADPIGVLIGVLEGLDPAGREIAEYADRLRIAGLTCEGTFDSLQDRPTR